MRRGLPGTVLLLGALAFSLASYSELPARVAIHWNIQFEPDGYAGRFVAAVVTPLLFLLAPVVAWLLTRIDPKRESHRLHHKTYWRVWNVLMGVLAGAQSLIIANALGWGIDMARASSAGLGLVLILLGNLLSRVRPNWWIGVRTPWTLSNDEVWRRTHRLGARTMIAGGVVVLVGGMLATGGVRSAALIAGLLLAVAVPIVYSYLAWRRIERPA